MNLSEFCLYLHFSRTLPLFDLILSGSLSLDPYQFPRNSFEVAMYLRSLILIEKHDTHFTYTNGTLPTLYSIETYLHIYWAPHTYLITLRGKRTTCSIMTSIVLGRQGPGEARIHLCIKQVTYHVTILPYRRQQPTTTTDNGQRRPCRYIRSWAVKLTSLWRVFTLSKVRRNLLLHVKAINKAAYSYILLSDNLLLFYTQVYTVNVSDPNSIYQSQLWSIQSNKTPITFKIHHIFFFFKKPSD
jgi:hypothetical protein